MGISTAIDPLPRKVKKNPRPRVIKAIMADTKPHVCALMLKWNKSGSVEAVFVLLVLLL